MLLWSFWPQKALVKLAVSFSPPMIIGDYSIETQLNARIAETESSSGYKVVDGLLTYFCCCC